MAQQATWEKSPAVTAAAALTRPKAERLKFLIGGLLILAAVGYLIVSGTLAGAAYFMTVDQLLSDPANVGKTVRISGAVMGDTIVYDTETLTLGFSIANIPQDVGTDLATTLENAVNDPTTRRLPIYMEDEVKPDLLRHRAQAILTGHLGADGVFYADELLLKCPSRFLESSPELHSTLAPQPA